MNLYEALSTENRNGLRTLLKRGFTDYYIGSISIDDDINNIYIIKEKIKTKYIFKDIINYNNICVGLLIVTFNDLFPYYIMIYERYYYLLKYIRYETINSFALKKILNLKELKVQILPVNCDIQFMID